MNETNEKVTCYFCGEVIEKNDVMEFSGRTMCRNCYDANVTTCECCGDLIWDSDSRGDENITLCQDCYDDHYTHCETCNRIIHNEDAYYEDDSSDYPYCESCYNRLIEQPIKSYRYKPEPVFYGNNDMYMGVELEIDKAGEIHDNAEKLLDIANMNGEHIYCKHDGSIEDGFEIVSHPMTLDYHVQHMNWKEIFNKAIDMGYRSHKTYTCGLHIHVSRIALGDCHSDREYIIARIIHFVEMHWNELLKFSRRTEENINRWARRYGIAEKYRRNIQEGKG